jgi:hypothetical protein
VAGQRVGDRQQLIAGLAAQAASRTETPKKLQIATWSIGVTNVRTVAIAMTTGIASQSKATAAETAHRAVPVARLPDCEAMSISHETSICEYWPVTMTVVIPAHQEAEIIGACLSSLLRQDYEHAADVVVVANGCDDATADIVRRYMPAMAVRNFVLQVHEVAEASKPAALTPATYGRGISTEFISTPTLSSPLTRFRESRLHSRSALSSARRRLSRRHRRTSGGRTAASGVGCHMWRATSSARGCTR